MVESGLAVRRGQATVDGDVRAVDVRSAEAGEERYDSGHLGGIAGPAHGHPVVEPGAQRRAFGEREVSPASSAPDTVEMFVRDAVKPTGTREVRPGWAGTRGP